MELNSVLVGGTSFYMFPWLLVFCIFLKTSSDRQYIHDCYLCEYMYQRFQLRKWKHEPTSQSDNVVL